MFVPYLGTLLNIIEIVMILITLGLYFFIFFLVYLLLNKVLNYSEINTFEFNRYTGGQRKLNSKCFYGPRMYIKNTGQVFLGTHMYQEAA